MVERSHGRLLAPVALVVFAALLIVVVATWDGVTTSRDEGSDPAAASQRHLPRTYVVRRGDSLSSIAARTGVPVERLEELNPDVDPGALLRASA